MTNSDLARAAPTATDSGAWRPGLGSWPDEHFDLGRGRPAVSACAALGLRPSECGAAPCRGCPLARDGCARPGVLWPVRHYARAGVLWPVQWRNLKSTASGVSAGPSPNESCCRKIFLVVDDGGDDPAGDIRR